MLFSKAQEVTQNTLEVTQNTLEVFQELYTLFVKTSVEDFQGIRGIISYLSLDFENKIPISNKQLDKVDSYISNKLNNFNTKGYFYDESKPSSSNQLNDMLELIRNFILLKPEDQSYIRQFLHALQTKNTSEHTEALKKWLLRIQTDIYYEKILSTGQKESGEG